MRQYLFLLAIFTCLFTSCEQVTKKSYRLSDEELAHVMLDFHTADVILAQLPFYQQDSLKNVYWKKMSEVYGLSEEELRKEIELLESDPAKMTNIVNRVKIMVDSIQ